jgi:subtilisin family serine protease
MEQGRHKHRQEAARARGRIAAPALVLAVAAAPAVALAAGPRRAPELGPSPAAETAPAVPGEVLVRFGAGASAATREDARDEADTRLEERLPVRGLELLRTQPGTAATAAAERLEEQPGVIYAELNRYRSAFRIPNDPYFGELWALHNTGQTVAGAAGTPDADIDAPEAWDLTGGDASVPVAVIDSGVSRTHPDLAPNLWSNPGETGGGRESNGVDDDHNGFRDDAAGWDWIDSDADPSDANGHGTHVAGTVGARGDNGAGVSGVAWRTSLMTLRTLDADGSGTVAGAIAAYGYAGAKRARVINASFGGSGFSRSEYDAIRAIPQVLFVAAAGNKGSDNDAVPQYPCNYELPNVVCVAASGQRDALAGFSNRGASSVDLAAPGTSILSTWPGGYAYSNGTSMAAPHVSGAAALAFAYRPGSTAQSVKQALLAGVDVLPSLAGLVATGGRLNAYATLAGRPPAPAAPAPPAVPSGPPAAAPDRSPPSIRVRVRARQRLRTLLRRGVRATITCSEACRVRARALLVRRPPRRAGLIASAITVAGRESAGLTASRSRRFVIKLRRSAKRRLVHSRRAALRLKVSASDRAGNTRVTTRRIRVRRSR